MIEITRFSKPRIARKILDKLQLTPEDLFLEPSAGVGAIAKPIITSKYPMPKIGVLIELDRDCYDQLEELVLSYGNVPLIAVLGDFLSTEILYRPTAIAMNPPRAHGQDIAHIKHAYRILADGGRMVAIASESAFLPHQEHFREWLSDRNAECERVPQDSFEGTADAARMIYIEKPQQAGA